MNPTVPTLASTSMTVAEPMLAASPFLQGAFRRHAGWVAEGGHRRARASAELADELGRGFEGQRDRIGAMRLLRVTRDREMARIGYRDLAGLATLDETLLDLSTLAQVCCQQALRFELEGLEAIYGRPRDADGVLAVPVILGMGKLGGNELNFSSDIDLIGCHSAPGTTDGDRSIDNSEFFKRAVQGMTQLLSERTEHGFVFRVDLMLRPFGSAGPVSVEFDAAEDYYQEHGREWERYALIKARPVAGDLAAGYRLLHRLRPFVYRRYLDFNAIGSLRTLKKLIADDVARRRQDDNVKLGRGGIRELEFIVQSFQLVRGGQEPPLRDSRLRPVLRYLGASGHLGLQTAQRLDDHYVFLRRLENAIQMYADEQTHVLPRSEAAQTALCLALGIENWQALTTRLSQVRAEVHEEFRRVFALPLAEASERGLSASIAALWQEASRPGGGDDAAGASDEGTLDARFGARAAEVRRSLIHLRDAHTVRKLSVAALDRLRQLLPLLLEQCLLQPEPTDAATRTLTVIQAIGGRSTYLTLLRESAVARQHLVQLCSASPWITQMLATSPALLDALLDTRTLFAPPGREAIRDQLRRVFEHIPCDETEAGMDALRRYRLETTLRIAAADVTGGLPLVQVSDRLTWLAEAIVQMAFDRAYADLAAAHGVPRRADGSPATLAAIAYGKFGGIELGYGSDLDLVFVHDCDAPDEETRGGSRPVSGGVFMVRWSQRIIHWLATLTPAGRAYEIDLELRPSGRSGLSVVSMDGFSAYQRRDAWTWEHQALTRARAVAGSTAIAGRFRELRQEVLCAPRDPAKLLKDIGEMRAKMRSQLERREPGLWDLKQGAGGLIDIEFITQYLLLREAPGKPELLEFSDNWRQLEALTAAGVIDAADRDCLTQAYRTLRAWSHARGLQQQPVMAPVEAFAQERAWVQAICGRLGL